MAKPMGTSMEFNPVHPIGNSLTPYQPTIANAVMASHMNLYGCLILGIILQYMAYASLSYFLWLVKS